MPTKKEPYAYVQPGEIIFFISQERDQPINPKARYRRRDLPIGSEPGEPEGVPSFDHDDDVDDVDDNDKQDASSYDEKIDKLIGWSNGIAKGIPGIKSNLEISRVRQRELHFPGTLHEEPAERRSLDDASDGQNLGPEPKAHGAFSLIPAEVRLHPTARHSQTNPEGYVDLHELALLVVALDKARGDQPLVQDGIICEGMLADWLITSCSEWGGGGGPGGIPEPYRGSSEDLYPFVLPADKLALQALLSKEGEGVNVAVLDTCPSLSDLAEAYERFHKVNPANQPKEHHPLLESLLRPSGPLVVYPASLDELLRMRAVHLRDHDYDMSAHGTFVAGQIHQLASRSKIHLFEVLNFQGVGDLMSIALGFWKIFTYLSDDPLVVNFSASCRIPRLNQPIEDLDPAFMEQIIKDWETHEDKEIKWLTPDLISEEGKEWLARQGAAMEWICDHLFYRGSHVIAAAGNDWRPKESPTRPDPGLPAGFDRTLGIGAFPKGALPDANGHYPVSSYSNISDKPEIMGITSEVGVATLGGEAGERNGVLGLFIGKFPDMQYRLKQYPWYLRPIMWVVFTLRWGNCIRPRNVTCTAWWCGTSFAAPIVTGLVASVLSSMRQPTTTRHAIRKMYTVKGINQGLTTAGEGGIEQITQPDNTPPM